MGVVLTVLGGLTAIGLGVSAVLGLIGLARTNVPKFVGMLAVAIVVVWVAIAVGDRGKLERLLDMLGTVFISVVVCIGIWVISNMVVSSAKRGWPMYAGIAGALFGALFFGIMRGTLSVLPIFAAQDPLYLFSGGGLLGHAEWPVIGAIVFGAGSYLTASIPQREVRLAAGVAMGAIAGALLAWKLKVWYYPSLDYVAGLIGAVVGAGLGGVIRLRNPIPTALIGAAIGFSYGAWGGGEWTGAGSGRWIGMIVPMVLLGLAIAWNGSRGPKAMAEFDNRARATVFLGPALLFLFGSLIVPAITTFLLSLRGRDSVDYVGFENYNELFTSDQSFDFSEWSALFTSRLFWIAFVLAVAAIVIGLVTNIRRNGEPGFERNPTTVGLLTVGAFILSMGALSVLRGTFFNNLWWVITVVTVATVAGLLIAVLADRSSVGENAAKTLIFMPMAISFVGASIVWRLQYQARPISKNQTGVLNAIWVGLGKMGTGELGLPGGLTFRPIGFVIFGLFLAAALFFVVTSKPRLDALAGPLILLFVAGFLFLKIGLGAETGSLRLFVIVFLVAIAAALAYTAVTRLQNGQAATAQSLMFGVVVFLAYRFLAGAIGGYTTSAQGEIVPDTVLFLTNTPFNNIFLMIILIWMQTGFAMVILSAAIKAVPQEFIEAARVDGATESQTFFNVTLPSILPTVGVVVTTMIVQVTKVYDIVKVAGQGGKFGNNVLANEMFEQSFSFGNRGLGSAVAVVMFLTVLPVMVYNIYNMQKGEV